MSNKLLQLPRLMGVAVAVNPSKQSWRNRYVPSFMKMRRVASTTDEQRDGYMGHLGNTW
jgi:hypothetical protein